MKMLISNEVPLSIMCQSFFVNRKKNENVERYRFPMRFLEMQYYQRVGKTNNIKKERHRAQQLFI